MAEDGVRQCRRLLDVRYSLTFITWSGGAISNSLHPEVYIYPTVAYASYTFVRQKRVHTVRSP